MKDLDRIPRFAGFTRLLAYPGLEQDFACINHVDSISIAFSGRSCLVLPPGLSRLRLVHESPPASPGATHARTLPLRYLAQTIPTTYTPLIASYDCPMKYRAFSWSNVVKAAENCLTLSFASVCFPPKIEVFLPEGNTLFARLNRSSGTSPFAIAGPETTAYLLPHFLRTALKGEMRLAT